MVLAADQRRRQALRRTGEPVREAALDARVTSVHRTVHRGRYLDDVTVAGVHVESAADAAVAARGAYRRGGRRSVDHAGLRNRAGWAGVDAPAAGDAGRVDPRPAGARCDDGVRAASHQRQRECALHLVADPHAAPARDAQVTIEMHIWVRGVLAEAPPGRSERTGVDSDIRADFLVSAYAHG